MKILKVTSRSFVCFVFLYEYCQEAFFSVKPPQWGTYLIITSYVMYISSIKRNDLLKSLSASSLAVLAR